MGWTVRGSNLGGSNIFCTRPDRAWASQPRIQRVPAFFPRVKLPGRGFNHAKVKEKVEIYI